MGPTVAIVLTVSTLLVLAVAVAVPLRRRREAARRRARRAWSISTAAAGAGVPDLPTSPEPEPAPEPAPAPSGPVPPTGATPRRRRADSLAPLDVVVHDGRIQTVESVRHRLGGVDLTFTDGRSAALRPFDTLPGPPPHGNDAP